MMLRFARALRRDSTDVERLLWSYLRAKRLSGYKFRRQQPIGPYIVDFVCYEKRIIVECDGGQHAEQSANDALRDNWFTDQGYRVLRFWDNDVLQKTQNVLEVIYSCCKETLPYIPSHKGRGGTIKLG